MKPLNKETKIIEVNTYKGTKLINTNRILYVEATNKQAKIVFRNLSSLKVNHLLKWFENYLDSAQFYRCHKSYIIHFNFCAYITCDNIILTDNVPVPVSRAKYKDCKQKIGMFLEKEIKVNKP